VHTNKDLFVMICETLFMRSLGSIFSQMQLSNFLFQNSRWS